MSQFHDAVFTWVDGNDPAFMDAKAHHAALWRSGTPPGWEKRSSYTGEAEARDRPVPASQIHSRFRDKEELRYALRSIHQNAPWIRRIYIITNGQVPRWLDLDHPQVAIVPHEALFDDCACLPTFNSNAIESTMHRIPGLSDDFIYFNDDFFLARPVTLADFIDPDGKHKLFVEAARKMPRDMTDRSMIAHSWAFNHTLLDDRVGASTARRMFAHTPQLYNKHLLAEIQLVWREHFDRTRRNRFRTAFDAAFRLLYTYYVGEGKRTLISQHDTRQFGRLENIDADTYAFIKVGDPESDYLAAMAAAEAVRPAFMCVNDELPEGATPDEEDAIRALTQGFLARFFPVPSPFERADVPVPGIAASPAAATVRAVPIPVQPGQVADFGDGEARPAGPGWHPAEPAGLWSSGVHAELRLRVDPWRVDEGFAIRWLGRLFGTQAPGGRLVRVDVRLGPDDGAVASTELRIASDDYGWFDLPAPALPPGWDGEVRLVFDRVVAPSPADFGVPSDTRRLGICVRQLIVDAA